MMDDTVSLVAPPEAHNPDQKAINWLLDQGVNITAIASPWSVMVCRVLFQPNGGYRPSPIGEFAYIVAVIDNGIIDAAAWSPASGRVGTRLGEGACLGQGQIEVDGLGTT